MVKSSGAAAPSSAAPASVPASYEAALSELESLVQNMERGELSLELSLASYQRGAELIKYCQQALTVVEAKVKILDGELMKPFQNHAE